MASFQSLIGRLKTIMVKEVEGKIWKFQSLIGRLKTLEKETYHKNNYEFQSLIGRLKTSSHNSQLNWRAGCFNPL